MSIALMVLKWIWSHRKQVAIGLVVLGVVWFISSWKMRGTERDALKIQLENTDMRHANEAHKIVMNWYADREACAEIADILTETQRAVEVWKLRSDQYQEAALSEQAASRQRTSSRDLEAAEASAETVAAVRRADTLEAKVEALARAIQARRPQ